MPTGISLVVGLIEIDHPLGITQDRFTSLAAKPLVGRLQESGLSRCTFEPPTVRFDANLSQLFHQLEQELAIFRGILSRAQASL
ncbi:MAG: hypothetical protein QF408_07235 [Pirellulales bacterium]|nr:hypothetical protein [Pirellulales bacterium]